MSRITLSDDPKSAIIKMAEGNPGAAVVLGECFKQSPEIDPDALMGGFTPILTMDTLGVCGQSIRKTIAILRAFQLGFMTEISLKQAVESRGEGISVSALVAQVEEKLPKFQREVLTK